MTDDVRSRARAFFNALDFTRPIGFGSEQLVPDALPRSLYVEKLHGERDAVQELADQIDFSLSAGSYLFTGNRGTGKTTELLRLAEILRGYDCEVFYADMADYVNLTRPLDIADFLISVMGAFSEKLEERFRQRALNMPGFFARVLNFLNSDVRIEQFKLPLGPLEFKAALQQDPTFKEEIQQRTRGYLQKLLEQAREFALEGATLVRNERADLNRKIVLIVDSIERLRGVGSSADISEVFKSAETLFSGHADKLRFGGVSIVYTVPPYLSALAGALGSVYAGGRIYALQSAHIYAGRPAQHVAPTPHQAGLAQMRLVVDRRCPDRAAFFSDAQLDRLAQSSGGDLRDYFRMLRLAIARAPSLPGLPIPDQVLADAESDLRNDMPIADRDRQWLVRVAAEHDNGLESLDRLPDFARLQEGKYLLHYRNGEDWYDVHPLLRAEISGG
jgi:hypothetical protein